MRQGGAAQAGIHAVGSRSGCARQPADRPSGRPPCDRQCHEDVQPAARLRVSAQGVHRAAECAGYCPGLRRRQPLAADVLLSQAPLPGRPDELLRSPRCRSPLMGLELVLPFLRPIAHLITDPGISEIMVNGSKAVFVERDGIVSSVKDVELDERSLRVAIKNIARALGDDLSEEHPILDPRLSDGSRVAAVCPPCSLVGTTLTIRKFQHRFFSVEQLIRAGMLTQAAYRAARDAIQRGDTALFSGGPTTGKTTLLNAISACLPEDDRIVVIEDTAELYFVHPNIVRFQPRRAPPHLPPATIPELPRAALRSPPGSGTVRQSPRTRA